MPAIVNTELTAGMTEARGVKNIEPEDVAEAIVAALKVPKVRRLRARLRGRHRQGHGLLPRSAREGLSRALRADRVLMDFDPAKRAAYERRAAQSEPGLEPEDVAEEAKA